MLYENCTFTGISFTNYNEEAYFSEIREYKEMLQKLGKQSKILKQAYTIFVLLITACVIIKYCHKNAYGDIDNRIIFVLCTVSIILICLRSKISQVYAKIVFQNINKKYHIDPVDQYYYERQLAVKNILQSMHEKEQYSVEFTHQRDLPKPGYVIVNITDISINDTFSVKLTIRNYQYITENCYPIYDVKNCTLTLPFIYSTTYSNLLKYQKNWKIEHIDNVIACKCIDKNGSPAYVCKRFSDTERDFVIICDKYDMPELYAIRDNDKYKIIDISYNPINIGYGTMLMNALIESAVSENIAKITGSLVQTDADTIEHKNRRRHFYEKFGFQVYENEIGDGYIELSL